MDIDDADKDGAEQPGGEGMIVFIGGVRVVVPLNEAVGLKYALCRVEVETAPPHPVITFGDRPLILVILIVRHDVSL